ncbi:MAG: hypothetical protein ABIP93_04715 [Gemmatimonadaceae bacterium]
MRTSTVRLMSTTSAIARLCMSLTLMASPLAAQTSSTPTPWTVTLQPSTRALPIGTCSAVAIALRDSGGRNAPRNPQGMLITIADFDMTVSGATATDVVGEYRGATNWFACACQSASVGGTATITASYPATALATRSRVPGIQFQSTVPIVIAAPQGTGSPTGCTTQSTSASTAATVLPVSTRTTTTPIVGAAGGPPPASFGITGPGMGAVATSAPGIPSGFPSVLSLGGSTYLANHLQGGAAVVGISSAGGAITRGVLAYEPIVVEVQPGTPMDPWLGASWAGTASAMSGALNHIGGLSAQTGTLSPSLQTQLVFTDALVLSTTIPALNRKADGATSISGFRVTLAPAKTAEGTVVVPVPPLAASRQWAPQAFVLTIPNVSTVGVMEIAPFVVERPGAPSALPPPGAAGVRSMLVTITESAATDWIGWFNASLGGGTPTEKSLTLDLIARDMTTRLARISGSGVGIVALRRVNGNLRQLQAELYVKQITLSP